MYIDENEDFRKDLIKISQNIFPKKQIIKKEVKIIHKGEVFGFENSHVY